MLKRVLAVKRLGRPITHRQIPIQIGLDFPTYEKEMLEHGGIENQFHEPLIYDFNHDFTRPEWSLIQNFNL